MRPSFRPRNQQATLGGSVRCMNFPQHVENRHFNFLLSKMAIEVGGNQSHILVDLSASLEDFPEGYKAHIAW